jgi:anthranilate phosphoribosyltransferase
MVNTDPAKMPLMPRKPLGVYLSVNTLSVLWSPALATKRMASTTKTTISKLPRMVPIRAEVRIP